MFLKSIDAFHRVKNAKKIFEFLEDIVMTVGEKNVVQVITNNTSKYVLAGKMLKFKYRTIFSTPCSTVYTLHRPHA